MKLAVKYKLTEGRSVWNCIGRYLCIALWNRDYPSHEPYMEDWTTINSGQYSEMQLKLKYHIRTCPNWCIGEVALFYHSPNLPPTNAHETEQSRRDDHSVLSCLQFRFSNLLIITSKTNWEMFWMGNGLRMTVVQCVQSSGKHGGSVERMELFRWFLHISFSTCTHL
jgi:hypothetical protein